jgi:hypothetical protein
MFYLSGYTLVSANKKAVALGSSYMQHPSRNELRILQAGGLALGSRGQSAAPPPVIAQDKENKAEGLVQNR